MSFYTVIHPEYSYIERFVNEIPAIFEKEGELIYKGRNVLKTFQIEDLTVVVKSFKKPHLPNKIVYTFFRQTKARRSFENAVLLLEREILTPFPLAYIEEKQKGLLARSFYISVFEKGFREIREEMMGIGGNENFVRDLAFFISDLHKKGILQKDLSPGNILTQSKGQNNLFCLVDINRMLLKNNISKTERYKNFKRISEKVSIIDDLAENYADFCSYDKEETKKEIHKYISRYSKNYPK